MIRLDQRAAASVVATGSVTLSIDQRVKSRLRVVLDDGREGGVFLARGESLSDGDRLASECGEVIIVNAADERLSAVVCTDNLLFARACYHLGNRHVSIQIGDGELCYLHDHVLDEMLCGLGIEVSVVMAPFTPEPGAYGGGHSHDSHEHSHDHEH